MTISVEENRQLHEAAAKHAEHYKSPLSRRIFLGAVKWTLTFLMGEQKEEAK